MLAKILRGRLRESDHTRHPLYLPRDEGVLEPVLPAVCRGGQPQRQHVPPVRVRLAGPVVVHESHSLVGLLHRLQARVQRGGVRGSTTPWVERRAGNSPRMAA